MTNARSTDTGSSVGTATQRRSGRKEFLDKKELAVYLGLSVFTIDTWVSQRREIPFVKMGKRVMFEMSDVEAWVENNKVRPKRY